MSPETTMIAIMVAAVIMATVDWLSSKLRDEKKSDSKETTLNVTIAYTIIPFDYDGDFEKWCDYIESEINNMGIKLKEE